MLGAISYDPLVHIEIGPLSVSPHGVGIAVGFLAGARVLLPRTRRLGIHDDDVYTLLTLAAVGAIVGARAAYVVNHASDFESVLDVLRIWEGGISLLGGFFGAIVFAIPAIRNRRISFWRLMDAAAPGMAFGVVLGRIGDLVVGDHLGKVTTFFLGYRCPPAGVETASPCDPGTVVHQTALYDLVLTIPLLLALLWLRRRPRFDGFLIMVFAAWYGTQRIIEDFLREDVRRLGLTGSQFTALVTMLVTVGWLVFGRRTPRWGRWDELPAVEDADTDTGAVTDEDGPDATAGAPDEEQVAAVPGRLDAGFGEAGPDDAGFPPTPEQREE